MSSALPPSSTPTPTRLRPSEWLFTSTLLLILAALILIANIQARRFSVDPSLAPPPVAITIDGLVSKPGTYLIELGTPLSEVLRKARPKRFADLSAIDPSLRITTPLQLHIAPLTHLTIHLQGAVQQPGPLTVPVGTRLSDLKKLTSLSKSADLAFLKKRRLLLHEETIVIPHLAEKNL